jgi:hypothetical protein
MILNDGVNSNLRNKEALMLKINCWFALILIALILSGCGSSGSDCRPEDYDHFDILLDDPANGFVVSESCRPE